LGNERCSRLTTALLPVVLVVGACQSATGSPNAVDPPESFDTGGIVTKDYDVVTVLPKDAIPAIDEPRFLAIDEADELYSADEWVIGVSIGGENRAYSVPFLSGHEIVNDTVGGRSIAVTW
jgi:hypothetical protein